MFIYLPTIKSSYTRIRQTSDLYFGNSLKAVLNKYRMYNNNNNNN